MSNYIHQLASGVAEERNRAAELLFTDGRERISAWLENLLVDPEFRELVVDEQADHTQANHADKKLSPKVTVGIAVLPDTFNDIHAANASPALADAPADQDVFEFELEFEVSPQKHARLDILTTKTPGGAGAIARFLEKFGEGIQQVEIDVSDVDRTTQILRTQFQLEPVYPATRAGANGTRVNFFLVTTPGGKKVLVEFVEQAKRPSQ